MKQITSWTFIHTSNVIFIFQKFHGPILTLFGYFAALSYIISVYVFHYPVLSPILWNKGHSSITPHWTL